MHAHKNRKHKKSRDRKKPITFDEAIQVGEPNTNTDPTHYLFDPTLDALYEPLQAWSDETQIFSTKQVFASRKTQSMARCKSPIGVSPQDFYLIIIFFLF